MNRSGLSSAETQSGGPSQNRACPAFHNCTGTERKLHRFQANYMIFGAAGEGRWATTGRCSKRTLRNIYCAVLNSLAQQPRYVTMQRIINHKEQKKATKGKMEKIQKDFGYSLACARVLLDFPIQQRGRKYAVERATAKRASGAFRDRVFFL